MRTNSMLVLLGVFLFCPVAHAQRTVPTTPPQVPATVAPVRQGHDPSSDRQTGTIEGGVYWDASAISHIPASTCSDLAITVFVGNSTGGKSQSYTPLATVSNNFKYVGQVKQFLVGGKINVFEVCTYGYGQVPIGPDLRVKLNITKPGSFSPASAPQDPTVGPITIINGQCNMLPHIANPTASDLAAHWSSCQNMAYNVNFAIQSSAQLMSSGGAGASSGSGAQARMLSSTPQQGTITSRATQVASGSSANLLQGSGSVQGGIMPSKNPGPTGTPSSPATPGSKVELGPQPLSPKLAMTDRDVITMLQAGLAESVIISSLRSSQHSFDFSSTSCNELQRAHVTANILNAMGDGSVRPCSDITGAGPSAQLQSTDGNAGLTGSASIGGAGAFTGSTRPALSAALTGGVRIISGNRVKSSMAVNSSIIAVLRQQKQAGSVSPEHTLASGTVPPILTEPSDARVKAAPSYVPASFLTAQENVWCQQREAQGAAPAILRVGAKPGGTGVVYSPDPQAQPYTIVGCGFGSSTGNVVLGFLQLDGSRGDGAPVRTRTLNIQSWNDHEIVASLDPNTSGLPDWENVELLVTAKQVGESGKGSFYARRETVPLTSIPQNGASLYLQGSPYLLSPAADYYGLNGTLAVMRQSLSGPVAAQDRFNLPLAPGFVVDSTQTDLLVSNLNSNVSSQSASVSGNSITVTYPVMSQQSGSSVIYYSIYGLKIWVTGPAGVPPLAPKP